MPLKPQKRTGLIFFPAFDWAISPCHPEREERLLYTQDQVFEEGLLDFDNIREYKPGIATAEDINRAHICVEMGTIRGRAAAYVCSGFSCKRPVTDPKELAAILEQG